MENNMEKEFLLQTQDKKDVENGKMDKEING